jgi:hypothetical protein
MRIYRKLVLPKHVISWAAIGVLVTFGQTSGAQSIDALVANGGVVHLRTVYSLSHTLIIPSHTHLICDAGGRLFDDPPRKLQQVLQAKGSDISIEGCDIYANTATVIVAIGDHSSAISITRNHIHSFNHAHGILLDAPDIHGIKINDNTLSDVGYGILQNVHAADLTDVTIDGNTFTNVWGDGVELNDPVTVNCCGMQLTDVRASAVTINHNKFSIPKHPGSHPGAGFCVGVAGAYNIEISDNECVAWNEGIHVEDRAYNIKILRNTITTDDHDGHNDQSAVWIIDGHHMTISGNIIKDAAGDGIHLTYDQNHQTSDIEITENEITGCGRYGLFIAGGSLGPMNSKVHHNQISGCGAPVFLTGKLKSLSIDSNRLEAKDNCVFHVAKNTAKADIGIKNNRRKESDDDANSTCDD